MAIDQTEGMFAVFVVFLLLPTVDKKPRISGVMSPIMEQSNPVGDNIYNYQ